MQAATMRGPRRSTAGRVAWIVGASAFAVLSLAWGTVNAVNALSFDRQEFDREFTGPVVSVSVDSDAGSVRIIGSELPGARVEGRLTRGLSAPDHREVLVGDELRISSDCSGPLPLCAVDYEIRVPAGVVVTVRSSGGSVRVQAVDGDLDIGSSGGGVRLTDVGGDLRIRTDGGSIRGTGLRSPAVDASSNGGGVRLEFAAAPEQVEVASSGGGVHLTLPDDALPYALDVSSSGGSTRTDVRTDPTTNRTISARSSGGGVTIEYVGD